MSTQTAQWRPVVRFEGLYEVSDFGAVRSVDRVDRFGRRHVGRILRGDVIKGGYRRVTLAHSGNLTRRLVHHLVLETFVGPRPPETEGCHGNGQTDDNRLSNLRWDTHPANVGDSLAHGTNRNARKTHCPRGHKLAEPNLTAYSRRVGRRSCLACARAHATAQSRGLQFTQQLADEHYALIGEAS